MDNTERDSILKRHWYTWPKTRERSKEVLERIPKGRRVESELGKDQEGRGCQVCKGHAGVDVMDRLLSGWKEIAKFFGVSESTIRRKARDYKLPIYRLPGGRKPMLDTREAKKWLKTENG